MAKQCMIVKKNENKLHEHDVKFKNIRGYIAPPPIVKARNGIKETIYPLYKLVGWTTKHHILYAEQEWSYTLVWRR